MSKFYADSMLGKLSRFLRFLGYDTLYRTQESIEDMLEISSNEERIILSQAKNVVALSNKRNIQALSMPTTNISDQLQTLKSNLDITFKIPPLEMRCSMCNGNLNRKEKDEIIESIPEGTAKYYDIFWQCSVCDKVFWMGSHWEEIKKIIENISKVDLNED